MCGIAGIISVNASLVNYDRLKKMTDSLIHRGPDGEGHWINASETTGLGHRRLSIIDLSDKGIQPMHYMDRYIIIHNGEIYNYIELKEDLISKGYHFYSKTDTEVIAAAYDNWGEDCVDFFDGMFAFALWDKKEKNLFAARDRFGEKPFFYYIDNDQFVFASEMKALWASGIKKEVNRKLLFNYLTIGYVDNPNIPEETFYSDISRLPAASFLKLSFTNNQDKLQLSITGYWDIDTEKNNIKIRDREAVEKFNFLFEQSVKRRLRSDVAVGCSLSGGLDSSSVAATVRMILTGNGPISSFTASFPGFEKDETELAKIISENFNFINYSVGLNADSFIDELEELNYYQEEPFTSASAYAQYKVYELAQEKDVKVLLDGQGADELLAGYHRYYKWYWQELFRKRKLKHSGEVAAAAQLGVTEKFRWKNRLAALFPEFAGIILEKRYLLNALRQEDLTSNFIRLQSKEAYYIAPEIFTLNGILYFNTCIHGLKELLRYADRNSMAYGREVRLPFLSHELVEFLFSLSSDFKIRHGWTKWLLRESMKNRLPEYITWRKDKVGFEPPQQQWMQNSRVKEFIHEAKRKLVNEHILKPEVLQKSIEPKAAYERSNSDWRYLSSAILFH